MRDGRDENLLFGKYFDGAKAGPMAILGIRVRFLLQVVSHDGSKLVEGFKLVDR